jgi:molecular chaperone HtpG
MSEATLHAERLEFKTELKQLLHLITHSLYSNKEIFLRELISNASDAINKIKFDSLQHEDRLEGNKDWKIKISVNKALGTLTISDNGIGMSRESAIENLGTIARSGTRAYLEALRSQEVRNHPELIGQFGVGFYSAFMVADRVTVLSRMAGNPADGVRWESDGQGEFSVEAYEKPTRGTDVILHLKADEQEFLEEYRLRSIIKKFSDFIEHPVVMDVEREVDGKKTVQEEVINSRKAIWLRNRSENTDEEYKTFYKQISNDFRDPQKWIHYNVEGSQEFRVLVFLPAEKPFDMQFGQYKPGLRLYVQRVLIMDHCEELLPPYLRFVRGVVDSSDLPLNISRELLQSNPLLEKIRHNVTRAVLRALEEMRDDDYANYVKWFKEFGTILKEGPRFDYENRERIAELLLFESEQTPAGEYLTLPKYVEAMPSDQKAIYYLTGDSREQLSNSPYLEAYRARKQDVLLLTDPVDEFLVQDLRSYKGKRLEAVDRADSNDEGVTSEAKLQFAELITYFKGKLPEVSDVRLTSRLQDSAVCLVTEGGVSAHMERLMKSWGRGEIFNARRILEINPKHATVQAMLALFEKDRNNPRLEDYVRLLYDQAVIAEGSRVKDPVALARRINALLMRDASQ